MSFARSASMLRHKRATHSEKKFHCEFCSSKFARRDDLRSHVRRIHTTQEDSKTVSTTNRMQRKLNKNNKSLPQQQKAQKPKKSRSETEPDSFLLPETKIIIDLENVSVT